MSSDPPHPNEAAQSSILLPVGICLYWVILLIYYPGFYAIQDERIYLSRAHRLVQGQFRPPAHEAQSPTAISVYKYPAGQALLLAPFLKADIRSIHLLNPILLTLATWLLAAFYRQAGLSSHWALLLLFHPVALLYSRTLMSDLPAAFCYLLALWLLLYRPKHPFRGGLALGYTLSLRVAMVPIAGLTLIYLLWRGRHEGRWPWALLGGFALGAIPFLLYLGQVDLLAPGAYGHDSGAVSPERIITGLGTNFVSLNLIYPGLLVAGLIPAFPHRPFVRTVSIGAVVVLSPFPLYAGGEGALRWLLLQRYFLFIIPLLLIGYAHLLQRWLFPTRARFVPLLVLLVAGTTAMQHLHQQRLDRNHDLHRVIYAHTHADALLVVDDQSEELVQEAYGTRDLLNVELVRDMGLARDTIRSALAQGREVFLIRIDREPDGNGALNPMIDSLRSHFRGKPVVAHTHEWEMEIYQLATVP